MEEGQWDWGISSKISVFYLLAQHTDRPCHSKKEKEKKESAHAHISPKLTTHIIETYIFYLHTHIQFKEHVIYRH